MKKEGDYGAYLIDLYRHGHWARPKFRLFQNLYRFLFYPFSLGEEIIMASQAELKVLIEASDAKVKEHFETLSLKIKEVDEGVEAVFDALKAAGEVSPDVMAAAQTLRDNIDQLGTLVPAVEAVGTDDAPTGGQ